MEGVFPELSTEELDEFEADLRALGFREPHDWSVGFDPNNVPWRRGPHDPDSDDEEGAARPNAASNQPLQVFMMQGGVHHPHPHPHHHHGMVGENKMTKEDKTYTTWEVRDTSDMTYKATSSPWERICQNHTLAPQSQKKHKTCMKGTFWDLT